MTIAVPRGLSEINRCNPNNLPDLLRDIKGPGLALGDFLNKLAATANAGNAAAVAASQTATVAGTPATNDELTVNVGDVSVVYTIADGTSATTAATGLKNALNADADFAADYVATNVAGVLTVTARYKGTGMNGTTFSVSRAGAGATTFTAGGASLAGGSGTDDTHPIVE